MGTIFKGIGLLLVGFVIIMLVAVLMALPFMWCWNYVVPELFGLSRLGPIQSACLVAVSGLLFKSNLQQK